MTGGARLYSCRGDAATRWSARMTRRQRSAAVILAMVAAAPSVHAQESESVEELLDEDVFKEYVEKTIDDEPVREFLRPYQGLKELLSTEIGLDVAMQHVLLYQRATGGRRPRDTAISNLSVFGEWRPFIVDGPPGKAGFSFERRDTLSNATVPRFSSEVGTAYRTNDLSISTRDRTALRQLWWKHWLADGRLALSIGKLNASSYYDRNRFAGSSSTGFFSQPFATNPTRRFPGDGLGFNLTFEVSDLVQITGGVQDANGNNTSSGFGTIGDGDLFAAVGLHLTPAFDGLGAGNYRFTLWHTDETDATDDGVGFLASCDQDLGEGLGAFLRYGYSERQVGRLEHLVSAGLIVEEPFGLDRGGKLGVGVAWTRGNRDDDGEVSTELIYRFQLTTNVQVTPSVLVVFDPQRSDKEDPVAVFGIRMRLLF
jgi:hypothetical protein